MSSILDTDGRLVPQPNDSIEIDFQHPTDEALTAEQKTFIIISMVVTPIILLIGLVGNTLNIIVFHHSLMKNYTYRILLVIAVSDIVILLHVGIFFFLDLTLLRNPAYANHLSATLVPIISAYTGHVASGTSTWLIVFITFKRWTDIYCPLSVITSFKWTRKGITSIIISIFIATSLLHTPLGLIFGSMHSINHTRCVITYFAIPGMGDNFYWFYGIFLTGMFRVIPIVILSVFNVVILHTIKTLWRVKLRRQSTLEPMVLSIASFEQTRISFVLVILSSITALSLLPGVIHFVFSRHEQYQTYIEVRQNIYTMSNRLTLLPEYLKSAVSSYIYVALIPKYQYTCNRIFCCSNKPFPENSMREMLSQMFDYNVRINVQNDSETSSSRHLYELGQLQSISRFMPSINVINPWHSMAEGLTNDILQLSRSESNLHLSQRLDRRHSSINELCWNSK